MIEVLVAQTSVVIVLSAITGLVFALATAGAIWVYFKVFGDYEGNIRDVQRFIELTNDARSLVPPGLPLLDRERAAATADAIGRFQAKKDEARWALWHPRTRHDEPLTAHDHPRHESISAGAVGSDAPGGRIGPVQERGRVSVRG